MNLLQTGLLVYFGLSILTTIVLYAACVAARRADAILDASVDLDRRQQLTTSEPRLMHSQAILQPQSVVVQRR